MFSPAAGATNCAGRGPYNGGMNIIYADSLFALSLLTDYLLCLVTARFCGLVLRRGRYAAAALVGALYAVAVFLPGCARDGAGGGGADGPDRLRL